MQREMQAHLARRQAVQPMMFDGAKLERTTLTNNL